jgi:hypothetical protein
MALPSTPCIQICRLDPQSGLCTGCGRTLDEITRWGEISEEERLALIAVARGRLARLETARRV